LQAGGSVNILFKAISQVEIQQTKKDGWRGSKIKEREVRYVIHEVLQEENLTNQIKEEIAKWEAVIGVKVAEWGVKQMKTKWGTCNIKARRIWLNLELIKKPIHCLEYIIVHEMVHLLERHHNDRFMAYMNSFMPLWQYYREELNREPLGHESWEY
jgi:predicted metal-dependent hydrolase